MGDKFYIILKGRVGVYIDLNKNELIEEVEKKKEK